MILRREPLPRCTRVRAVTAEKPRQDKRRQKHIAACGEKQKKTHSAASCVCMFLTSGRMIAGKSVPALK